VAIRETRATSLPQTFLPPHHGNSDGESYSYNRNGNLASHGERSFTWDTDNKPTAINRTGVGTTTFAYSGDGARVMKVELGRPRPMAARGKGGWDTASRAGRVPG